MGKEKTNNKKYIIIITILSILLLVSIGYIAYDKIAPKETPKTEEKQEEEETEEQDKIVTLEELEVSNLLEQIDVYNKYIGELYPLEDTTNISNSEILSFAYLNIPNLSLSEGFMQTELEKVVAKYFGSDFPITHDNIMCFAENEIIFKYNPATRKYDYYGEHGHGGPTVNGAYTYFIDGTYNEAKKVYTINTKVLYREAVGDTVGPDTAYYGSAQDGLNHTNELYKLEESEIGIITADEVYQKIQDNLKITTYEFKVDEEGNNGLTKVIIN